MAQGNGRMTWEEVCKAYPDEWVVMNDLDMNRATTTMRSGIVIAHGPNKKEVLASAPRGKPELRAIRFTGGINVEVYEALRMAGLSGRCL